MIRLLQVVGKGVSRDSLKLLDVVRPVNSADVINVTLGCSYVGFEGAVALYH